MVKVVFRNTSGESRSVEGREGSSIMQVALLNDIAGIPAECGGSCSCGTCHVLIDSEWISRLPKPESSEQGVLDMLDQQEGSRLSCQIILMPELNGIIVELPVA